MNTLKNINKQIFITILLSVSIVFTPKLTAFAQEEMVKTTNETLNNSKSSTTSESIKDIKKIIKKNIENNKVKGAIDNLLNRKIAMIGRVTRITDTTITIENISGIKILALNDNLVITKNGKPIDADKIEVDNWIITLGKLEDDNFSPSFIFVFSKTLRPKNQVVMIGTISSISKSKISVTSRSKDKDITLKISKKTNYKDSNNDKANISDFSEDINVLITGFEDDGEITIATLKSLAPLSNE